MAIKLEGYKKQIIDELKISEIFIEEVIEEENDITIIYVKNAVFNYPYNSVLLRKYKVDFNGVGDSLMIKIRG